MTREIKFRAWDTERSDWCRKPFVLNSHGSAFFEYVGGGHIQNHLQITQYTGLKDKNGKEIYEGDILSFPDTESEYVDVGIGLQKVAEYPLNAFFPIEYRDGAYGVEVREDIEALEQGWHLLSELFDEFGRDKLEIIGNIYEDADLLQTQ